MSSPQPEKQPDAVTDGRHLMENDDPPLGHPACVLTFGSEIAVRESWGIQILRPSPCLGGAIISRVADIPDPPARDGEATV